MENVLSVFFALALYRFAMRLYMAHKRSKRILKYDLENYVYVILVDEFPLVYSVDWFFFFFSMGNHDLIGKLATINRDIYRLPRY